MRIFNFGTKATNEVVEQIPEAREVFHKRNISASNRVSLANEAAATSNSTEEVMAVLDYRTRRSAQRSRRAVTTDEEVVA